MTSLLVPVIILSGCWILGSAMVTVPISRKFSKLDLNDKAFEENILFDSSAVSLLACASRCNTVLGCIAFTFHAQFCRGHGVCVTSGTTSTSLLGARTFSVKNQCVQSPGEECQVTGATSLAVPALGHSVQVYCDNDWMVILKRQDGSVNFYRNWTEYVAGFGDAAGEYWLGLEVLHQITTANAYKLQVDMRKWDGTEASVSYSNFSVGPSSGNYTLDFADFLGGTTGDSLDYHKGREFSTFDVDNDGYSSKNCAVDRHGGWWYHTCNNCNLCGDYKPNATSSSDGVNWGEFTGYSYSLKFAQMKIRPMP